jgi:hypothetical protein
VNEFFSIFPILPATPGSGVYTALKDKSTRNIEVMFLGSTACQLSRQCGILKISQPYRPTLPVIGILSKPQGLARPEGFSQLRQFVYLSGSRTCDISALTSMLLGAPFDHKVEG